MPSPQQIQKDGDPTSGAECWTLFDPLEGSWVLLVSSECTGVPAIRYALLRARPRIALTDRATSPAEDTPTFEQLASPGYVDMVCGIKEFLQETMPAGVHTPFESQRESTVQFLSVRWRVGRWPTTPFPLSWAFSRRSTTCLRETCIFTVEWFSVVSRAPVAGSKKRAPLAERPQGVQEPWRERDYWRREAPWHYPPSGVSRDRSWPVPPEPGEESSAWIDGPPDVIK
ncbi:hypothetical protein LZ31DRAFT_590250 [Colletotrichum somersetense]|nr:hypothetical protein LZ31DRAFT_590250 [Colletotrichum somersetense]